MNIQERAESFLSNSGYGDTVFEEARENNTAWHFVYVRVEPEYDAKVFSDVIHLKVAKDTGGIIGIDAMEYIRKETTKPQKITKKDWKSFFHSSVRSLKKSLLMLKMTDSNKGLLIIYGKNGRGRMKPKHMSLLLIQKHPK